MQVNVKLLRPNACHLKLYPGFKRCQDVLPDSKEAAKADAWAAACLVDDVLIWLAESWHPSGAQGRWRGRLHVRLVADAEKDGGPVALRAAKRKGQGCANMGWIERQWPFDV